AIADVLKNEGYIENFEVKDNGDNKPVMVIHLKYHLGRPVIDNLKRVSRPSIRIYQGVEDLTSVQGGLGVAIVSTSKGVMSDKAARKAGIGGEVIGIVS